MGNTSVKPHPRGRHKKQVHWKAADRPSPPGKPQLVSGSEHTPDVVTIRWDPPRYDGGAPITGYLVEHRRYGSPHWVRATPLLVAFTELSLSGLEPGWRYQFRISAENAVGLSLPGELSELLTVTLQRSAVTAPRFIDELNDSVALENERVEFCTQFLGQPPPSICWFKDGFEIFSSRRIKITTDNEKSVLTIHQCALSDEGEIKCTATNRAGHASTKAKLTLEAPPSIRLPRQYEDGLLFELGEVIRLKVSIAGRPTPLIFWSHNNESIKNDDRHEIENTDKYSTVRIEEADRDDRGEYQVKAVNKLGDAVAAFLVTVTDKPSPPSKARVVMTLGRSVTLSWNTPEDDGGCKIGNYIVEYFRLGWDVWLKAATCRQLSTTIGDLIEGSEYKFRIKAESPYGVSEPGVESEVVFIPDPKRGILSPTAIRSKSQSREEYPPVPAKRQPRSLSSTRAEKRTGTPVHFYEGGVPVRPARNKVKSPSITPEISPKVSRREIPKLDKNLFDRSSMARDLAYGTPEIEMQKAEAERVKSSQSPAKSTVNVIHRQDANIISLNKPTQSGLSPFDKEFAYQNLREKLSQLEDRSPSPRRSPSPNPRTPPPSPGTPSTNMYLDKQLWTSLEKSPSPQTELNMEYKSFSPRSRPKSPSPPRERSPSPRFSRSRSPSPNPTETKPKYNINFPERPRDNHDSVHNSSEFMLVLLPHEQKGRENGSQTNFDFDESAVPPPMSLSAPELGSDPLVLQPLRASVSSTELLHEYAMQRFYKAMAVEEAELEKKLQDKDLRRPSADIPKIQINSRDDQNIVGLERRGSLRRRLSGGSLPQYMWTQRRHSLRNTPDLDEVPENTLHKFKEVLDAKSTKPTMIYNPPSLEVKREMFSTRQRSASEEKEEEEFEKVRAKMATLPKERKTVNVVKEEDWDEEDPEYEESITESESSEDERIEESPPHIEIEPEETYHPGVMQQRNKRDEPFEILTKPNPLPDPNFVPKPILKRRGNNVPAKPIRKTINPSWQEPPLEQRTSPQEAAQSSQQRSLSLFSQSTPRAGRDLPMMKKRGRSPIAPRNISSAIEESAKIPVSIGMPKSLQPVHPEKKSEEEIKVVVDHYGDIVRSFGQKKKSVPQVYLTADDLKAAAEEQEDSKEAEVETTANEDDSAKAEEPIRRRSFVLEASSAIIKTVKERVSAALAANEEDEEVPSSVDIAAALQRKGSAQASKRRTSRPTNRLEVPKPSKRSSPSGSEGNWSNLRTPSPSPQGRKPSPSPMRRNSLILPTAQVRKNSLGSSKPKMREITTQTADDGDPKKDVLWAARQELLTAKAEYKVRSTLDYITDLAMFIVACWLYLFINELLAVPVLFVMVYRQLKEEVKKKLPRWMLGKKK